MYREKLVRLRDLYVGQLDHMQRNLKSLRKQFLLQWQHESRKKKNGKVYNKNGKVWNKNGKVNDKGNKNGKVWNKNGKVWNKNGKVWNRNG